MDGQMGRPPNGDSAVRQLMALPVGGCYARAEVIEADKFRAGLVVDRQRKLSLTVATAVTRARQEYPEYQYRQHSAHAFTQALDVIVTVAVVREK